MIAHRQFRAARSGHGRRRDRSGLSPIRLALAVLVAALAAGVVGLWLAGFGGTLRGLLPGGRAVAGGPPGELIVTSDPPGTGLIVDGSVRGRTPLTLSLPSGERHLVLRLAGYADLPLTVEVAAGRTSAVAGILWRATPVVRQLRPPLPGASIAGAQFLDDGRVALTVTLPPGAEQQIWIVDDAGAARRVGPSQARLAVALSPDGARVAYAAAPTTMPGMAAGAEPLPGELWIAGADGTDPGALRLALPPTTATERLVDLAWTPDSRHLIAVAELRPEGGGVRSRLLLLDADTDAAPIELFALPSEVAPGSWTWRPDGGQVAFVARAGGQLALCLLGTEPTAGTVQHPLFRYLGDLPGDRAPRAAPVAWVPASGEYPARVLYTIPAPSQPGSAAASRSPVLYAEELAGRPPTRLGDGAAAWPAWREDGRAVAIAKGKKDGVVLRVIDPAAGDGAGSAIDLAALPLAWGGGQGPEVRWDVGRGRALLLRPATWVGEGGELWLLDWRDEGVAPR